MSINHFSSMLGTWGLGVAPLGNLYASVSEASAHDTMQAAIRHGVHWFDVAPLYGFGLAEERLGRFLETSALKTIISTKVGRVLEPTNVAPSHAQFVSPLQYTPRFDYSAAGIERSYEDSLKRLRRDRVEILLLHDVDVESQPVGHRALVKQLLNESLPTLHRLKSEKRIDAVGLGVCHWEIGYEILSNAEIDCILLAGRYTLLDQSAFTQGFLETCARRGIAVLAGGVFNSGFLACGDRYDYRPASAEMMYRRAQILEHCERHRVSLPAAALQFTAAHPAIASVTVGARSPQEVETIVRWKAERIPNEFWRDLKDAQLIPFEAPTPREI